MATSYSNLPGVFLDVLDGQLTTVPSPGDPIVLILGTSDTTQQNGVDIEFPFTVSSTSDATVLFGASSGLSKGMLEAAQGGATNFRLYRTGASGAGLRTQWEGLFEAFDLMYDQPVDVVVPYGVYLDDENVMDMSDAAALALDNTTTALGLVYPKKVAGVWKFAWWFPDKPTSTDLSTSTFDSTANTIDTFTTSRILDPSDICDGTQTRSDFHQVNFAYQLAEFCHRGSSVVDMRLGFIGVNPPATFTSLSQQADWVGTSPEDTNGDGTLQVNGTGLLGDKFMAGRFADGTTISGHRAGKAGGGFFATAEVSTANRAFYASGAELADKNGNGVDIGRYISVMATWATVGTGSGWQASAAATYAGFVTRLAVQSAPTNKSLQGMLSTLGSVAAPSFDLLAGAKYVGLMNKATRSAVVTDSPTAAQSSSDYRRLSTMRQVEEAIDGIREVSEPFLGEGMTAAEVAALDTAIGSKLRSVQDRGGISGYQYQVIMTAQDKVLGQATVQLKLIPAFELRQITVVVGLSAS